MPIPHKIHHVWTSGDQFKFPKLLRTWKDWHPGYAFNLWTCEEAINVVCDKAKKILQNEKAFFILKSEVIRHEVLRLFGGLYVDTDMECLKPFDDLLDKNDSFVGYESPDGNIGNSIMACTKNNPVFMASSRFVIDTISQNLSACNARPVHTIGEQSRKLQRILARCETIYPYTLFYPFNCMQPEKRGDEFKYAMAKHHWHCKDDDGWMNKHKEFIGE